MSNLTRWVNVELNLDETIRCASSASSPTTLRVSRTVRLRLDWPVVCSIAAATSASQCRSAALEIQSSCAIWCAGDFVQHGVEKHILLYRGSGHSFIASDSLDFVSTLH